MSAPESRYLKPRHLRLTERIGNIMIPGSAAFPSFAESGCIHHIDIALASSPADEIRQLQQILTLLSYCPGFVLTWLLNRLEKVDQMPAWNSWLAAQMRLLGLGLRGLIFNLYYSGPEDKNHTGAIFQALDFHIHCQPDQRLPRSTGKTRPVR